MIWDPLKDRAQFLYQTLEKVGFSSGNYRELLDLYNERVNKYSQKNNELLDGIPIETEQKIQIIFGGRPHEGTSLHDPGGR